MKASLPLSEYFKKKTEDSSTPDEDSQPPPPNSNPGVSTGSGPMPLKEVALLNSAGREPRGYR